MSRRTFLKLAAAAPLAALAAPVGATSADPLTQLVPELFRLRADYDPIPDPTGYADTPEHDAAYAVIQRIEAEINARPIVTREGVAAYCRYLAEEAELFDTKPEMFDKIIDWAEQEALQG